MAIHYNLSPNEVLEYLYKGKHNGHPEEDIFEFEEEHERGTPLPPVLREFYNKYMNLDLCKAYNYFEDVLYIRYLYDHFEEEKQEWFKNTGMDYSQLTDRVKDFLLFAYEDQNAWTAGIWEEDLKKENPPVYLSSKDLLQWEEVYENIDSFLAHKILWENSPFSKEFDFIEIENPLQTKFVIQKLGLDISQLISAYTDTFACCWDEEQSKLYMFLKDAVTGEAVAMRMLACRTKKIAYNLRPEEALDFLYGGEYDGYTEEEIQEVEEALGIKLPAVLRNIYRKYGKYDIMKSQDYLREPDSLMFLYDFMDRIGEEEWLEEYEVSLEELKKRTKDYLLFAYENQGVWNAGILKEDLDKENPPVYMSVDTWFDFEEVSRSMDSFLANILLCQNGMACKDFHYLHIDKLQIKDAIKKAGLDEKYLVPTCHNFLTCCWDEEERRLYLLSRESEKDDWVCMTTLTVKSDRSSFKQIKSYLGELKELMSQYPGGTLSLPYRVKLYQQIQEPEIIYKIFLECAKYIYPAFQTKFPEDKDFPTILHIMQAYLYEKVDSKKESLNHIIGFSGKYRSYVNRIEGPAGIVVDTIWQLAYSISRQEKDIAVDNRLPDYTASLVQVENTKTYWEWYIEMVDRLLNDLQAPLLLLPTMPTGEMYADREPYKKTAQMVTPQLKSIITKIDGIVYPILEKHDLGTRYQRKWESCEINVTVFPVIDCEIKVKSQEQELFLYDKGEIALLFQELREKMHKQYPEQGAWLQCSYNLAESVYPGKNPLFNYTQKRNIPIIALNPEGLQKEFQKYPRLKKYTPVWWQNVLEEDAFSMDLPERTQRVLPCIQQEFQVIKDIFVPYFLLQNTYFIETIGWNSFTLCVVLMDNNCLSGMKITVNAEWTDGAGKVEKISPRSEIGKKIIPLFESIKEQMYKQCPSEGAWLQCSFTLYADEKKTPCIEFNYDDFALLDDQGMWQYRLKEFQIYPRSKEYTPLWWQRELTEQYSYLPSGRRQTIHTDIVKSLMEQVRDIVLGTVQTVNQQNPEGKYVRTTITCKQIAGGFEYYFQLQREDGTVEPCLSFDTAIIDIFSAIKSRMYQQAPSEGAWIECIYVLECATGEYTAMFNYDSNGTLTSNDLLPERIKAELNLYPRSEEFTPEWLKHIFPS